jgi:hypothetical protein
LNLRPVTVFCNLSLDERLQLTARRNRVSKFFKRSPVYPPAFKQRFHRIMENVNVARLPRLVKTIVERKPSGHIAASVCTAIRRKAF